MSIAENCTPPHRVARGTGRVTPHRPVAVYDPKLLRAMRRAFEAASRQLPAVLTRTESGRRILARRVLIHVDRGKRDPRRLAHLAVKDVGGAERVERRTSPVLWEETYAAG